MLKEFKDIYGSTTINTATGEIVKLERGASPQGFCYKSEKAWLEGFCGYVAESVELEGSEGYNELDEEETTREGFFRYVKQRLEEEEIPKHEDAIYDIVDSVFEECDWQYLSTRFEEVLDGMSN